MNLSSFEVKAEDRLRVCYKMRGRRVIVVDGLGTRELSCWQEQERDVLEMDKIDAGTEVMMVLGEKMESIFC